MYNIRPTTKFQKDLKRVKKRGFDISLLTDIIKKLAAGEPLPEKNRDHQLSGDRVQSFQHSEASAEARHTEREPFRTSDSG